MYKTEAPLHHHWKHGLVCLRNICLLLGSRVLGNATVQSSGIPAPFKLQGQFN